MDAEGPSGGRSSDGQRVYLTVLFADLSGFTRLSEQADPEDVGVLKAEFEAVLRRVIAKHRGLVIQIYGDGVLALFGFPEALEDAERAAVEGALDIHDAVRTLEVDIPLPSGFAQRGFEMHSGVHSGLVFVRAVDAERGVYDVSGDAVNVAQRVSALAGPGEIFVSKETLRRSEPFFDVEALTPLTLRGRAQGLEAVRVLGRSSLASRSEALSRSALTPLVGRRAELAKLWAAFARARAGNGRAIHVMAAAGFGKTRLLDSFRHALPKGVPCYSGACEGYGDVPPFRPFLQVVRQIVALPTEGPAEARLAALEAHVARLGPSVAAHAAALATLLGLRGERGVAGALPPLTSPETARAVLVDAVTALVMAQARAREAIEPLVLLLDDWHWADEGSNHLLASIVRHLHECRVLVIVGSREPPYEGASPSPLTAGPEPPIELGPFTFAESVEAVHHLLPNALETSVIEAIYQRSGGNPLFLEEVCRSWPKAAQRDESRIVSIPVTLHGTIQARVSRLRPELTDVLQTAAVVGNEFTLALLEVVRLGQGVRAALDELAGEGLVHLLGEGQAALGARDVFRFNHGITREVVYESVPLQRRRDVHREVARALEESVGEADRGAFYEALAYHFAGSTNHVKAALYAELSGDKALATSSLDRARLQYRAAMASLEATRPLDRERWLRVCGRWAVACVYNPARDQLVLLERASSFAEALGHDDSLAHASYWRGWIHYALGEQAAAISHYRTASRIAARTGNERLRVQLLSNMGQSHGAAGEYELALPLLDEGIARMRERASRSSSAQGARVGFAYALGCRALVHGDRGDFEVAHADLEEALSLVRGFDHAVEGSLLGLLGMVHVWQGAWASCQQAVQRARVTAEQVDGPYVLAMAHFMAALARYRLGQTEGAIGAMRRSIDWLEEREVRLFLSFAHGALSEVLLDEREPALCRHYAELALVRAEAGDPLGAGAAHRSLARLALRAQTFDDAEAHARAALEHAERRGLRREASLVTLLRGEMLREQGNSAGARVLLEGAAGEFRAMQMPWFAARSR